MTPDVNPHGTARAYDPNATFHFEPGGFLFVVSGPSGAGKGTLVERLVKERPECVFSISSTTRPRRPHEVHGVEYEFVSREEFEQRRAQGLFLESAEVHGHLYGTPAGPADDGVRSGRVVVLDVDVQGGASVRSARPEAVSVFIYPPSIDALRQRLRGRNTEMPEALEIRLGNAPGELKQYLEYEYVVMNDDLERAAQRLVAIVDAERARVRRLRAHPGRP
jgi:guanylate kinase